MPNMSVPPGVAWWLSLSLLTFFLCLRLWPFRAPIMRWIRRFLG